MERPELMLALEQVGPGGHALAMQLLGNRDVAADALQDALLTALRSKSIEQTHGDFKAWFLTVVRNRCLDILRQRKRRPQTSFHDGHDVEAADADPGQLYERHEQAASLGLVRGNTVRARHIGKDIMAGLRSIVGGEIHEYAKLIAESREQSLDRMVAEAESLGANAVVAVRFTTSVLAGGVAELLVVGTAVVVEAAD